MRTSTQLTPQEFYECGSPECRRRGVKTLMLVVPKNRGDIEDRDFMQVVLHESSGIEPGHNTLLFLFGLNRYCERHADALGTSQWFDWENVVVSCLIHAVGDYQLTRIAGPPSAEREVDRYNLSGFTYKWIYRDDERYQRFLKMLRYVDPKSPNDHAVERRWRDEARERDGLPHALSHTRENIIEIMRWTLGIQARRTRADLWKLEVFNTEWAAAKSIAEGTRALA
jgi:hypothetical protein